MCVRLCWFVCTEQMAPYKWWWVHFPERPLNEESVVSGWNHPGSANTCVCAPNLKLTVVLVALYWPPWKTHWLGQQSASFLMRDAFWGQMQVFFIAKTFVFSCTNTHLSSLQCGQGLTESQNRAAAIITVISWQPTSLCSVSEAANRVNVKEMNRCLQGTIQVQIT